MNATISGTVTDSSGAGVPDADVTLTNPAHGVSVKVASGGEGIYSCPNQFKRPNRTRGATIVPGEDHRYISIRSGD